MKAAPNTLSLLQPSMPETADIGHALRGIRKRNGWTLQAVASMTDVALSTLSKIENNRVSLSYDTLKRICHGLNIAIEELVDPGHPAFASGRRTATRRGEPVRMSTAQYHYDVHATELSHKTMVPMELEVRARSVDEFDHMSRHDGEEFVYVLEGEVEIHTALYAPLRLKAGESTYFDSGMAHAYISIGPKNAHVLSVCYDPRCDQQQWREFMEPAVNGSGKPRDVPAKIKRPK